MNEQTSLFRKNDVSSQDFYHTLILRMYMQLGSHKGETTYGKLIRIST